MSLANIDADYRLSPWLLPEHKTFIAGRYGSILASEGPEAAKDYLDAYKKKQAIHIEAYEHQKEMMRQSQVRVGAPQNELPDEEYLEWDPTVKVAEVAAQAAEEKPKKRGRPAKDSSASEEV